MWDLVGLGGLGVGVLAASVLAAAIGSTILTRDTPTSPSGDLDAET